MLQTVPHDLLNAVAKISGTSDVEAFSNVMAKSIMPNEKARPEEITAFLMVAKEYNLNPITKEIYAFPNRGGIQPIVSIDGWLKIINSHPQFDGMDYADKLDENGKLIAVTCRIYRKDRQHPTEMTEYMSECHRNTDPWKQWPNRMLRHKATIQAARYAFGFSGIADPDEAERISQAPINVTPGRQIEYATPEQVEEIASLAEHTGKNIADICKAYGAEDLSSITESDAAQALKHLHKLQKKIEAQRIADNDEIPV